MFVKLLNSIASSSAWPKIQPNRLKQAHGHLTSPYFLTDTFLIVHKCRKVLHKRCNEF